MFVFAGVDKAKFRHPITPGDQVLIGIKVVQRRSNIWKCEGTAMVDDVLCAEGELLAAIQDREDV
jgi:3-hydroxyacyl-[acyl-carrier-protein] dehydratase